MSLTDQPGSAQRGPERFTAPAPVKEKTSPLAVVGAVLALAVLLVGVPAGLWLWQGPPPYPTGLPSRDDLTQPLTFDALVVVLLVVVWLAWLQFAVCVVVEAVALLRGGGLPRPVPLSGRSQALARALVGTVLVGSSVLGSAGAASADDGAAGRDRNPVVATTAAIEDVARQSQAAEEATGDRKSAVPSGPAASVAGVVSGVQDAVGQTADDFLGRKVVVVQPPQGRYHHNLWDIAEQHLGDGRRWKEIYELNKGRPQPDGGELVIGRLIQPGWILVLPDDAVGAERMSRQDPDRTERQEQVREAAERRADRADDRGPGTEAVVADAPVQGLAGDLLGGGLLAATLAGALLAERRRRRGLDLADDEVDTEVALLVGADLERAERVDRALRRLAVSARAEGVPLPPVYALTVDDDAIELRIAPAAPTAPTPWTPLKDGRRWRLDRDAAAADDGPLGNAPYPGLVCIGRDADDADVLIDLEAVGGPASITGSPRRGSRGALRDRRAAGDRPVGRRAEGARLRPVAGAPRRLRRQPLARRRPGRPGGRVRERAPRPQRARRPLRSRRPAAGDHPAVPPARVRARPGGRRAAAADDPHRRPRARRRGCRDPAGHPLAADRRRRRPPRAAAARRRRDRRAAHRAHCRPAGRDLRQGARAAHAGHRLRRRRAAIAAARRRRAVGLPRRSASASSDRSRRGCRARWTGSGSRSPPRSRPSSPCRPGPCTPTCSPPPSGRAA
ncbi:hypothetical protein [Nocardioides sp. TF02-7]|uniref:LysM peptidoglycan-binding domain-containing protein n=1 Tax=Nocardioides sp. TF02-7 TaxID=2917724 RepID=UPI001F053D56|nr:hypothetical protein [Nocardioides sp. TF02-7]UMG93295.1 hypothetical protein MF408_03170 [Nocardioides sp. TF02-7]